MSFSLVVEVTGLTEEQGHAVEAAVRERDAWPVAYLSARRVHAAPWKRVDASFYLPTFLDRDQRLLRSGGTDEGGTWDLEPGLAAKLADTVRILGEQLPQGFALRATRDASEGVDDRMVSAGELAELVAASGIDEFTRYRVPSPRRANAPRGSADYEAPAPS